LSFNVKLRKEIKFDFFLKDKKIKYINIIF